MRFAISLKHRVFFVARKLIPAVFMHTQKTAGTSLITLARRYYKEDMISHGDYLKHTPESLSRIGFVSGHFGYAYARPLMQSRYSFTFLRDPAERLLSFYYFCRKSDPTEYPVYRMAQELKLEDFLAAGLESPEIRPYLWNQQAWALACGWGNPGRLKSHEIPEERILADALAHLEEFSHIGFTETFDEDMATIFRALRLPAPDGEWIRNANAGRPRLPEVSDAARRLIGQLTQLDDILYRHAWATRISRTRQAVRIP